MTQDELRMAISYDKETGVFRWLVSRGRAGKGTVAGCEAVLSGKKYRLIGIFGQMLLAHRLAWFYMTGEWPKEIDHRDGDGLNNAWRNLREATRTQNNANTGVRKDNTSGFKGVYEQLPGRYRAQIQVNDKRIYLGIFDSQDDARDAYWRAAEHYFGEFAKA